jgi:hypothetical protein
MPYYRAPKSAHDPLVDLAQMVADTIMAIGGPLFWGVLVIGPDELLPVNLKAFRSTSGVR